MMWFCEDLSLPRWPCWRWQELQELKQLFQRCFAVYSPVFVESKRWVKVVIPDSNYKSLACVFLGEMQHFVGAFQPLGTMNFSGQKVCLQKCGVTFSRACNPFFQVKLSFLTDVFITKRILFIKNKPQVVGPTNKPFRNNHETLEALKPQLKFIYFFFQPCRCHFANERKSIRGMPGCQIWNRYNVDPGLINPMVV